MARGGAVFTATSDGFRSIPRDWSNGSSTIEAASHQLCRAAWAIGDAGRAGRSSLYCGCCRLRECCLLCVMTVGFIPVNSHSTLTHSILDNRAPHPLRLTTLGSQPSSASCLLLLHLPCERPGLLGWRGLSLVPSSWVSEQSRPSLCGAGKSFRPPHRSPVPARTCRQRRTPKRTRLLHLQHTTRRSHTPGLGLPACPSRCRMPLIDRALASVQFHSYTLSATQCMPCFRQKLQSFK